MRRWSQLTQADKERIAQDTERMIAIHRTEDSIEYARAGEYQRAIELAGEVRAILRRIAVMSNKL